MADESVQERADEPGLRVAFLTYGGELYGFACRRLGDRQLAEEAVQETFIRAWRARDRFDGSIAPLRAWLFAIERRILIDFARARAIRVREPLAGASSECSDDEIERAMNGWMVDEAIRRLRPEHRQVVTALYFHGRSGADVARELGIPEGTVRSRLFYALRTLRTYLDEMGWAP